MKKLICLLGLLLLLFCVSSAGAEETEALRIDTTDSQLDYALTIARLNQDGLGISPAGLDDDEPVQLYAVLLRTDGTDPGLTDSPVVACVCGPDNCYTAYYASWEESAQAAAELAAMSWVIYAETDCDVTAALEEEPVPVTDEEFYFEPDVAAAEVDTFLSWGASDMNFGEYLPYARAYASGGAVVAVVDSGVAVHEMLTGRFSTSGVDLVDGDLDATNDGYGHGTRVAGIVVDCTPGMNVYIDPIRVLNDAGSAKLSVVVSAIKLAADRYADVINLSLTFPNSIYASLDDAVRYALSKNCVVVAAAGNKSMNIASMSPLYLPDAGLIVVAAASAGGSASSYTNYGTSVDVYAYGDAISSCTNTGSYGAQSGTSFAAPHISAAAALIRCLHPGEAPGLVESRIMGAAAASSMSIPDMNALVPRDRGFCLTQLHLETGTVLALPDRVLPATAGECICYTSSDETVVQISNSCLVLRAAGTAVITVSCLGFEESSFTVYSEPAGNTLTIAGSIRSVEDEAFLSAAAFTDVILAEGVETLGAGVFDGMADLRTVTLPESLTVFSENSFSGAVILCIPGSEAEACAKKAGLPYLAVPQAAG